MALQVKKWLVDSNGRAIETEWQDGNISKIPFHVDQTLSDFNGNEEEYVTYLNTLGEDYLVERNNAPPGKPLKSEFGDYDEWQSSLRQWEMEQAQRKVLTEFQPKPQPSPPDPRTFDDVAAYGAPEQEEREFGAENKRLFDEGNRLVKKGQASRDRNLMEMGENLLNEYRDRRANRPYGFEKVLEESNYQKLRGRLEEVLDQKGNPDVKENSLWFQSTIRAVNKSQENNDKEVFLLAEDAGGHPFVARAPTGVDHEPVWRYSEREDAEEHAFQNLSGVKPFGSKARENPIDKLTQKEYEFWMATGGTNGGKVVSEKSLDKLTSRELRIALASGKLPVSFKEEEDSAPQEEEAQSQDDLQQWKSTLEPYGTEAPK